MRDKRKLLVPIIIVWFFIMNSCINSDIKKNRTIDSSVAVTTGINTTILTFKDTSLISSGADYILNINTMKFHYPSCHSASQIKEKNRAEFNGTRDEAIAEGFDPCGNCHP